ncbi:MAG: DUF2085 domain-containing protein [Anaerolineae bacterium]|nr:DUF2085 domain-containing protein [Anaerolineae bacterium]
MQQATPSSITYSRPLIYSVLAVALGILGAWTLLTPPGLTGKADAVGYAICHRIEVRSFIAGTYQLPLCARCTGIYLGAMAGLGVYLASRRERAGRLPNWRVSLVLAAFVGVLAVDGLNSYFTLFPGYEGVYEPQNWLRLTTGVFTGIALITLVLPIFNQSVWADGGAAVAPLTSLQELAGLCVIGGLTIALVLVQRATLLLVLGLISSLGVVVVLTMIMTVGFLTTSGRFRTYTRWKDLWLPLLAGLTLAIAMIGTIDALRFSVMGTWEGFPLP